MVARGAPPGVSGGESCDRYCSGENCGGAGEASCDDDGDDDAGDVCSGSGGDDEAKAEEGDACATIAARAWARARAKAEAARRISWSALALPPPLEAWKKDFSGKAVSHGVNV